MLKFLSLCIFLFVGTGINGQGTMTVTAYFAGDITQIDQYDARKLTHIIFSFCHLKNNRLTVDDRTDTLRIQRLVQLKKANPSLKVLLSLGGWGGCATCSGVFSSDRGRKEFASSVKELNSYFGTDGIDLDWEYPAIEGYPGHPYKPEDKQNFTALVQELRDTLGPGMEISFAAGGFEKFINEAVEWEKVMPLVDRVNVMTYDLVNGYSTQTGHHTALFSTVQQKESTDNAISLLSKKGIPANKMVVGAAFYGRIWEAVADTNNGLYQAGKFKNSASYKTIHKNFTQEQGFIYHWDSVAKAPYLYNQEKKLFVTYDDKRSIMEKTNYVKSKGLNGIMFWELSQDLSRDGLLDAIDQVRRAN